MKNALFCANGVYLSTHKYQQQLLSYSSMKYYFYIAKQSDLIRNLTFA